MWDIKEGKKYRKSRSKGELRHRRGRVAREKEVEVEGWNDDKKDDTNVRGGGLQE
jgi:hypothetical protein